MERGVAVRVLVLQVHEPGGHVVRRRLVHPRPQEDDPFLQEPGPRVRRARPEPRASGEPGRHPAGGRSASPSSPSSSPTTCGDWRRAGSTRNPDRSRWPGRRPRSARCHRPLPANGGSSGSPPSTGAPGRCRTPQGPAQDREGHAKTRQDPAPDLAGTGGPCTPVRYSGGARSFGCRRPGTAVARGQPTVARSRRPSAGVPPFRRARRASPSSTVPSPSAAHQASVSAGPVAAAPSK